MRGSHPNRQARDARATMECSDMSRVESTPCGDYAMRADAPQDDAASVLREVHTVRPVAEDGGDALELKLRRDALEIDTLRAQSRNWQTLCERREIEIASLKEDLAVAHACLQQKQTFANDLFRDARRWRDLMALLQTDTRAA